MGDEKVVLDDLDPVEGSETGETGSEEQTTTEEQETPSEGGTEPTEASLEEQIDPEIPEPLPDEPEEEKPQEDTEKEKKLKALKINLRESDCPFFEDDELDYYLSDECGGDVQAATYKCLILKSMDTTLSVSGLSCADTSKYFLRLATQYAPNNSGIIEGF